MIHKLRVKNADMTRSFETLRNLIGIMGMLLPLVCYLGGSLFSKTLLQPSISAYYYTNSRDIFIGVLISVSVFMVTYRGYEFIDDLISTITGFMGLGIALFPCLMVKTAGQRVGFFQLISDNSNYIHVLCAGVFFLMLAINSIFIFTLTGDKKNMTQGKKIRNVIYIVCGSIIIIALVILLILNIRYSEQELEKTAIAFVLETILLEAFGISWLLKGGFFFRKKRPGFLQ